VSAPTQRMTAAAPPAMRFAVLGPLEVTVDGADDACRQYLHLPVCPEPEAS